MYPTYRYHPTLAPNGIKFTDEDEFNALGPDWVDTPAKFPPITAGLTGESITTSGWSASVGADEEAPKKRGRKPRTESE